MRASLGFQHVTPVRLQMWETEVLEKSHEPRPFLGSESEVFRRSMQRTSSPTAEMRTSGGRKDMAKRRKATDVFMAVASIRAVQLVLGLQLKLRLKLELKLNLKWWRWRMGSH